MIRTSVCQLSISDRVIQIQILHKIIGGGEKLEFWPIFQKMPII